MSTTPGELSAEQLGALTLHVLRVLDQWALVPEQQLLLLGLDEARHGRGVNRYRAGLPLPAEEDVVMRARGLCEIAAGLDTAFPHMPHFLGLWITTPLANFGGKTPLDVMLEDGCEGIACVLRQLDNSGGW
jgi:hypothetical protein